MVVILLDNICSKYVFILLVFVVFRRVILEFKGIVFLIVVVYVLLGLNIGLFLLWMILMLIVVVVVCVVIFLLMVCICSYNKI